MVKVNMRSNERPFVIFDMDGVLLDSEPLHLRAKLDIMAGFGVTGLDVAGYAGVGNVEFWNDMKREYGIPGETPDLLNMQYSHILRHVIDDHVRPMDGAVELLQELEENGVETALASASHSQLVFPVLEQLGLAGFFPVVVTGSDITASKPAPDIYLAALEQMSRRGRDGWAVEDTTNGIRSASGAGLRTIGFMNPRSGPQHYEEADHRVSSLREIADIILNTSKDE